MGGWKINRDRIEEGGEKSNGVNEGERKNEMKKARAHLQTTTSLRGLMGGGDHPPLAPSDNTSVEARCDWNVQIKKHVCFSSRTSMSICYREAPLFISVSRDLSPATACRATSHPHASMFCRDPLLMKMTYSRIHHFTQAEPTWYVASLQGSLVELFCRLTRAYAMPSDRGEENSMQMLRITWPL